MTPRAGKYTNPAKMMHAIALVAPSNSDNWNQCVDGINKLCQRMTTASTSRKFTTYEPVRWSICPSDQPEEDQPIELFFTRHCLTRRRDVSSQRIIGQIMDKPPSSFDTNGALTRVLRDHRGFCILDDNLVSFNERNLMKRDEDPRLGTRVFSLHQ